MLKISPSQARMIAQVANKYSAEDYKTLSKQAKEKIDSIDGPIFRFKESLGMASPFSLFPGAVEHQERRVSLHCAQDVKKLADQALKDLASGNVITEKEAETWFDERSLHAAWGADSMGIYPIVKGGRMMELQQKLVETIRNPKFEEED